MFKNNNKKENSKQTEIMNKTNSQLTQDEILTLIGQDIERELQIENNNIFDDYEI